MRKDNYTKVRISVPQILGILLMCTGLIIIIASGVGAYSNATKSTAQKSSAYLSDDIETTLAEEEEIYEEEAVNETASLEERNSGMSVMPLLLLGSVMILASVPLFYTSYTDKGLWLRLSTKYEYEDLDDDELEEEFDYPTDDYEYILDEEIRARLIAERDKKIKEMKKQRRKLLRQRRRRRRRRC